MTDEALREIAEDLTKVLEKVKSLFEPEQPKLEDVRRILADISRSGKTAEMKALLERFGASKLSEIEPKKYAALLSEAQEIAHA